MFEPESVPQQRISMTVFIIYFVLGSFPNFTQQCDTEQAGKYWKCGSADLCLLFQGSEDILRVVSMNKDYHFECYHCEVSDDLTFLTSF